MKKTLLAIAACLGLTCNLSAKNEDNGFGLKLNLGIAGGSYSKTYSYDFGYGLSGSKTIDLDRSGIGGGLALDSRWYVCPQPKWGVAVNARWLDLQYTSVSLDDFKSEDESIEGGDAKAMEIGFFGVGPLFTYYLGNDMAVDAYYNIVPTAAVQIPDTDEDDSDITYLGFGVSHHVGAAFRYKVFQGGVEYRLGKVTVADLDDNLGDMDAPMNQFRIFLGFKF